VGVGTYEGSAEIILVIQRPSSLSSRYPPQPEISREKGPRLEMDGVLALRLFRSRKVLMTFRLTSLVARPILLLLNHLHLSHNHTGP
jgi:hypothetical protein